MQTAHLANPSSTPWIVGGVLVVVGAVAYFVMKKPAAAATAGAAPSPKATCSLNPAKLGSWGIQNGYLVYAIPSGSPPTSPPVSGFGVIPGTVVAVTSDGKFWTYTSTVIGSSPVERPDLRDAYCKSVGATAGFDVSSTFMV